MRRSRLDRGGDASRELSGLLKRIGPANSGFIDLKKSPEKSYADKKGEIHFFHGSNREIFYLTEKEFQ